MSTKLTKRQRDFLNDLFYCEMEEKDVFGKHKIEKQTFQRWLSDTAFTRAFDEHVKTANMLDQAYLIRYGRQAVSNLIELTKPANGHSNRQACLDVIGLAQKLADKPAAEPQTGDEPDIDTEAASKLLEAMTRENTP